MSSLPHVTKQRLNYRNSFHFASTLQMFELANENSGRVRAEAPPTRAYLANQSTASRPHGASVKSSEKRDETSCPHRPGSSATSHQGELPF